MMAVLLSYWEWIGHCQELPVDPMEAANTISFAHGSPMALFRLLGGRSLRFRRFPADASGLIHLSVDVAASTLPLDQLACRRISYCWQYSGCILISHQNT